MRCRVFVSLMFLSMSIWAVEPPNDETEPSGQSIYEKSCAVCHHDGIAGAPRFRDEKDWQPRLLNKKIEDLVAIAIKGINAMPARGTCFECSDEDLKNAIQYMLPQS